VLPARFRPPVTLTGQNVELVPLERSHAPALLRAARDPEVQRYLVRPIGTTVAETERLVDLLLEEQAAGTALPFATRLRSTGDVVGMTRFLNIDPEDDSVDIGGTFLDSAYWRSPLNTDAKLGMLRHAFDDARVHRVSLQTDLRNERSQRAIARLGAVREGVHREDRHLKDGSYRSSVVYGILVREWPAVRERLEAALARPWHAPTGAPAAPR
jgi:RimJ/RimL family protein N-acetyltransferase